MKWLLITTKGKNPGDEFIRLGVQKLIRAIDPKPDFVLIDKEVELERRNCPSFDRVVWCGMPVFWSNDNNKCYNIDWWSFLLSLGLKNRRNAMIVGAGSFCWWDKNLRISDPEKLKLKARELNTAYWKVYVRDPIAVQITGIPFEVHICPASFAVTQGISKKYKLCNLMPLGAHYKTFGMEQSNIWQAKVKKISDILLKNNFIFVAHSQQEKEFAISLGWKTTENIVTYKPGKPEELAGLYSQALCFVGNRIHGSICSSAAGAEVLSMGFDSRQEAVKLLGAKVIRPSEINMEELEAFAATKFSPMTNEIVNKEWDKQLNIFKGFMG